MLIESDKDGVLLRDFVKLVEEELEREGRTE